MKSGRHHDGDGRRIVDGPVQRIFMAVVSAPLFLIVALSLLIWPPAQRWSDPRYRW